MADVGLRNLYGSANPDYYGRPGATISGFGGVVPATGVGANATDWIYSVSNATSKVAGAHTLRFGFQAEWRKTDQDTTTGARGGFTFNGRATGAANNPANAVADFLLGYCSTCTGTFGGARSTYKSPTFAPFIDDVWRVSDALTLQLGIRWEYLAPWHEVNDIEGSFDPVTGKIAYHKVPADLPASLLPLVIAEDNYFPAGIVKKDLNNFGPRLGMVYQLNERTLLRSGFGLYFDNLNLNELQFTQAGAAVQRTVRRVAHGNATGQRGRPLPGSAPRGDLPDAVLDEPGQRVGVRSPVERQRPAHLRPPVRRRSRIYRQPEPARAQAVQSQPAARRNRPAGAAPSVSAVRARAAHVERYGPRRLQGPIRPAGQTILRRALLHRQLSALEEPGQQLRRDRGERHGVRLGSRGGLGALAI